jgi:hypothetical protein
MSWDRPFDQPVPLPSGPPARTLGDVINYIKTLPKSDHNTLEWRVAMQTLTDAAEGRASMLFAKLETLRATNGHLEEPVISSDFQRHELGQEEA